MGARGKEKEVIYGRNIIMFTFISLRTRPSSPCLMTFMMRSDKTLSSSR